MVHVRKKGKQKGYLWKFRSTLWRQTKSPWDLSEWIISYKKAEGTGFSDHRQSSLKILTPKQMLQGLPIVVAQVKVGNTSENLLNEIRQIIYSLYRAKEITKKVCNNTIKLIWL